MPAYIVTDKNAVEGQPKERLVEAANQASARNFVARDRFKVTVASPADAARIVKAGGEYEVATGAAEVQEELEPEDNGGKPPEENQQEDPSKKSK